MNRLALQIPPILAAFKRHRVAVALMVLQTALTLAILCNALFIGQQRMAHLSRPTGIDDNDIAVLQVQWIGQRDAREIDATMRSDLQQLRELPDVVDAYADYTYPAAGPMAQLLQVGLSPAQPHPTALAEAYDADEHAIATLGLRLVAGRNFRADEITPLDANDASKSPASIIVTRALATVLFPHAQALGRIVYLGDKPGTIIGVVARLQVPALNTNSFAYHSVLLPYRPIDPSGATYMVRARPGRLDAVLREAPRDILKADRMRVVNAARYRDLRASAYSQDRGVAMMMGAICVILLAATAAGIFGLSGYWVEQRHKQIGIRRAIGATQRDILHHFQIENALIVGAGSVLGSVLAIALNVALMRRYELPSLPIAWILASAFVLCCLGQLAVLGPALRATRVPPMVATRTA